jgi:hypothetical protein
VFFGNISGNLLRSEKAHSKANCALDITLSAGKYAVAKNLLPARALALAAALPRALTLALALALASSRALVLAQALAPALGGL